ncbi:MAG: glycosyltransferase family 2 protein [Methylovirgula sp.]
MTNSAGPTESDAVAVVIATRGRPKLVNELISSLADQTRLPDGVFVVGSREQDIVGIEEGPLTITTKIGRLGSARQRNDGLTLAGASFPYIVFFDDDFVPSRYWLERVIHLFKTERELVSVTGIVLADGIKSKGISLEEGKRLVLQQDENASTSNVVYDGFGPYGCNMAFRYSAISDMTFDERLPLYAWLEDSDFGGRLKGRGRLVRADGLWGVHLGQKVGRGRGVTLGYSQIANAAYLARKGSLPISFVANIAARNFISNLIRSMVPEPFIDRRGRLYGNLLAIRDVMQGHIEPERAAEL